MKFKSLGLVLVAAATFTVGCAKKAPPAPSAAPTVSKATPQKQGTQPTGGTEKIVAKENQGGSAPKQAVSLLDGGWESNCVSDNQFQDAGLNSYRYYITISKGALLEQLYYFEGEHCVSYDKSTEFGEGDIWFFDVAQEGALNGAAYKVNYTDYNFESTGGIDGTISLKEASGKQTIEFDDAAMIYTRQAN
jgi:hypothetical protein